MNPSLFNDDEPAGGIPEPSLAAQEDATVFAAPLSPIPEQPRAAQTATASAMRPVRTVSKTALLALLVIVLALGGLGLIVYRAWNYGYLDDYLPERWRASYQPGAESADAAKATEEENALAQPETEHPLKELSASKEPKLRVLKKYVEPLVAAEAVLDRFSATAGGPGTLSPDTLTQLTALQVEGQALLDEYAKFEAQAKELTAEVQAPYVTLLRQQFEADFLRLIQLVGQAYALDLDGSHPAYELHVKVPWTLKEYGQIDPQQYDDAWVEAHKARKQTELDIQHADIYRDVAARQAAVRTLHDAFGEAMGSLPGYTNRVGVLDSNGHQLLRLLDSYLCKLEDLYMEYTEFRAKLVLPEEPERFKQYCVDYLASIKQDHLFCFTEIYRVYVDDERLEDPVYAKNLDVHFAFVTEQWPKLEFEYRTIAAQYEAEWARRWRGHGSGEDEAEQPEPPPPGAADEIPWMR